MQNTNKGFISIILAIVVAALVGGGISYYYNTQKLGQKIPVVVADFETTLASKISSSATSMELTSASTTAGSNLSGYLCFTIETEYVCGTASTTNPVYIESMIRGIDPIDGDLEVASLKEEHRRGSSVKITNHPQLTILTRIMSGDETYPNALTYDASVVVNAASATNTIPNLQYVNTVATSGAAFANYDTTGIVRLATSSQLTIGTATSSAGEYLVVPSELVHASSSAKALIPISRTTGKIDQGWLDLTESFTFTGATAFASSTFNKTLQVTGTSTFATSTITNLNVLATSTLTGTTTFGAIPILPSATPTTDYQVTSKAYVDDKALLYFEVNPATAGATTSNNSSGWVDWDLGSIISSAKAVEIFIAGRPDNAADDKAGVRYNGSSISRMYPADVFGTAGEGWNLTLIVPTNATTVVETYGTPTSWAEGYKFTVLGYWR